jgi:hypothetical protein
MAIQGYTAVPIAAQVDGTALTNSTTATSILPTSSVFTLPSNFFYIGKKMRIKASGRISTVVTTPGNLTLDVRLGTLATPIIVWNGGASALNIVAQTNASWMLEVELTCRAIGSGTAANLIGLGQWVSRASLNAPAVGTTTGVGAVLLPDTAPAVGTGFDSTITNVLNLFATFSVANAANSITCHQFDYTDLN